MVYGMIVPKKEVLVMDEERIDLKTKILAGIVGLLILVIVIFGLFLFLNRKKVTVPDFRGQTKSQVMTWAERNKVSDKQLEFSYEYDEEMPEDIVLRQSPEAKTNLKKKTLSITLSKGQDPDAEVTFPDFGKLNEDEIRKWFKDHGFENVTFTTAGSDLPEGSFVSMTPDTSAKRSDEVTVVLSQGQSSAAAPTPSAGDGTVPDFSNYSRQDVANWGAANNVRIQFQEAASSTAPKDGLINQSPAPGTPIQPGGTVTVTFSGGLPVTLVSQIGKPKAEADSWTTKSNLKPIFTDVYGNQPKGTIEYMIPGEGIVWEYAEINYGVSMGQVPVECFQGGRVEDADAYFAEINAKYSGSAKIQYSVEYKEDGSAVGTVISQKLNGEYQYIKADASPGSSVTLVVSGGVTVPSYEGRTEDDFLGSLAKLGVSAGERYEDYSDTIAAGSIIWNETGAMNKGDKVNYTVSVGPLYSGENSEGGETQG